MATIDAGQVKRLREMTSAGIMECKGALVEAEGDFDRAVTILREKLKGLQVKKGDRATGEGSLGLYVSDDGKTGVLVEVNCETDFVAKNEKFQELCNELARRAATASGISDATSLLASSSDNGTVEDLVKEQIGTIGENMRVSRVAKIVTDGFVASYIHHDHKSAALVEMSGATKSEKTEEVGRDLSTQIVAMRPQYVSRDEVPAEALESERAIYAQQAAQEGKPEAIQLKIAEGRLNKEFFQQVALLDQPFVKEQKQSVGAYLKQAAPGVAVKQFVRFRVGETG